MKSLLSIILIVAAIVSLSCSGNDTVSAAFHGDTELNNGDAVPFILNQNSPNPFNPTTLIFFQVAQNMHLTLKVYTEDWQEVGTLLDEDISIPNTGGLVHGGNYMNYMITFDGRDLASGIYYYVMEGGGYQQIRAMRLMK